MIVIDWFSFTIGFVVAAVLSNIVQLIIAYNHKKKAAAQMAALSEKAKEFKLSFKGDTDNLLRAIQQFTKEQENKEGK